MKCVAISALVFFNMNVHAQEVSLTRGDLSILKGETSINIELTYDKMIIDGYGKEEAYIKKENCGRKLKRTRGRRPLGQKLGRR